MSQSNKVIFGVTKGTAKEVESYPGAITAGLVAALSADGTVLADSSTAKIIGVSLGGSLSDTPQTAVILRGTGVPVRVGEGFTPTVLTTVYFNTESGEAVAQDLEGTVTTQAYYSSSILDGIAEDGSIVAAALIDFPGGLS